MTRRKPKSDEFTPAEAEKAMAAYLAEHSDMTARIQQAQPGSDFYKVWLVSQGGFGVGTLLRVQVGM